MCVDQCGAFQRRKWLLRAPTPLRVAAMPSLEERHVRCTHPVPMDLMRRTSASTSWPTWFVGLALGAACMGCEVGDDATPDLGGTTMPAAKDASSPDASSAADAELISDDAGAEAEDATPIIADSGAAPGDAANPATDADVSSVDAADDAGTGARTDAEPAPDALDLGDAASPADLGPTPDTGPRDTGVADAGAGDASTTNPFCGNGVLQGLEACDDGNVIAGDGCASDCRREIPYNCEGQPSICTLGPLLGPLSPNDSVSVTGGPLPAGGLFLYRLTLSSDVVIAGELLRPGSTIQGDPDFDLLQAGTPPSWNVLFSSAAAGSESFITPLMSAGDYAILVSTWPEAGPLASYTLSLRVYIPLICGNGVVDPGEACDDGNTEADDGCSPICEIDQNLGWSCNPNYYGSDDGCDCGCGIFDPDCDDASVSSCLFCSAPGGCNTTGSCPGMIDPANNAVCLP